MPLSTQPGLVIRRATSEDARACGLICYDAFWAISAAHNFPCDLPGPEAAIGLMSSMFSAPDCYAIVAEWEGRLIGSNCLDERSIIRGVGPITVDPAVQNSGAGRKLMDAVTQRAHQSRAVGMRLVQAAFHNRSFSLYTSLGSMSASRWLACRVKCDRLLLRDAKFVPPWKQTWMPVTSSR
jgi:GNAT superfamily N-acetyltransferase